MGAMRFGFMPSVKKNYGGATSYKTMVDQEDAKSIGSKDPAGFTAVDVLAAGSFATIISAGEYAKYYFILKTFAEKFKSTLPMGPLTVEEMQKLQNYTVKAESDLREKYNVKLSLKRTM